MSLTTLAGGNRPAGLRLGCKNAARFHGVRATRYHAFSISRNRKFIDQRPLERSEREVRRSGLASSRQERRYYFKLTPPFVAQIVVSIPAAVGVKIQLPAYAVRATDHVYQLLQDIVQCAKDIECRRPRAGVGRSTRRGRRDHGGYDPCRIMIGMQPPPAPSPMVPP